MQIKLDVKNLDKVIADLDDLGKKQLPFALAKALTDTAKDVQGAELRMLPQMLTLRTKWYEPSNKFGIKVDPATKTKFQSRVYSLADWLALQERGGEKIPHKGRVMLAIPSLNVRPTTTSIIPPALRPRALLAGYFIKRGRGRTSGGKVALTQSSNFNQGAFIGQMKSGKLGLWVRTGRTTRTGMGHIKLMYTLQPQATITPVAFFFRTANIQARTFPVNFANALTEARRTAL